MNAEFMVGEAMVWLGAEGAAEGMEMSRRSPRPDDAGAGFGALVVVGDVKEEKSPRTPEFEAGGGDFAFALKKSPPPPNMLDVVEERLLDE